VNPLIIDNGENKSFKSLLFPKFQDDNTKADKKTSTSMKTSKADLPEWPPYIPDLYNWQNRWPHLAKTELLSCVPLSHHPRANLSPRLSPKLRCNVHSHSLLNSSTESTAP